MQGQEALGFHQKYLNLCSEDERRSHGFGTTWGGVINDSIFIFGWTNPLIMTSVVQWRTLTSMELSIPQKFLYRKKKRKKKDTLEFLKCSVHMVLLRTVRQKILWRAKNGSMWHFTFTRVNKTCWYSIVNDHVKRLYLFSQSSLLSGCRPEPGTWWPPSGKALWCCSALWWLETLYHKRYRCGRLLG